MRKIAYIDVIEETRVDEQVLTDVSHHSRSLSAHLLYYLTNVRLLSSHKTQQRHLDGDERADAAKASRTVHNHRARAELVLKI